VSVQFGKLQAAFVEYYELGYSIIPILGDLSPANPKTASVDWKEWQTKRATLATFNHWGRQGKVGGLAIVTGRLSRLVVLDFDRIEQVETFQRMCSLLWNSTRRVISAGRQLPHVYFQVPPQLADQLHSQTFVGLDVQYEGRYIIANPTEIAGQSYRREWGGVPLTLNEFTLASLQRFLQSQTLVYPLPAPTGAENAADEPKSTPVITGVVNQLIETQAPVRPMPLLPIRPPQAQQKYEQLASNGRNNALFAVALELRDSGYAQEEALGLLLPLHLQTRQKGETAAQRQREAERSIASAYSRPARERQGLFTPQLLNVLREALDQRDQTAIARVLDALLQANWRPGDLIYYSVAVSVCKLAGIGDFSVRRFFAELPALLSGVGQDTHRPADAAAPLTPPAALTGLPAASADCTSQNAICEGAQHQQKRIRHLGRPPKYLRLPTFAELAQALGITLYPAVDALPSAALASVRAYRTAQIQARIARRPDHYAQSTLQRQYGVSRRTLKRYLWDASLVSQPHYNQFPIVWATLGQIPDPDDLPTYTNQAHRTYTPGWFLEDERGQRYPAYRGIAQRLLKQGATVTLKVQTANYYYDARQPQAAAQWQAAQMQAQQAVVQERERWQRRLAERQAFLAERAALNAPTPTDTAATTTTAASGVGEQLPLPTQSLMLPEPQPARLVDVAPSPPRARRTAAERQTTRRSSAKRQYRQPLSEPGSENLAQRLHQAAPTLSVWSARRLVDQYGYALCQRALVTLRKRGGVKDRAAWLYSYVRSEAKFSHQTL
jgi:hypothetical protein